STSISFDLATESKVTLRIFDVLGQEVLTVLSGNLSAGNHKVQFNANGLNSGVYFYQIDATGIDGNNFTAVKKMILNK
ncbi:MAG: T9SS type A sorting domain-containing protein, partial [Ignavibacterium sp.]